MGKGNKNLQDCFLARGGGGGGRENKKTYLLKHVFIYMYIYQYLTYIYLSICLYFYLSIEFLYLCSRVDGNNKVSFSLPKISQENSFLFALSHFHCMCETHSELASLYGHSNAMKCNVRYQPFSNNNNLFEKSISI